MKLIILILTILGILSSCKTSNKMIEIKNLQDIIDNEGNEVFAIGIYAPSAISSRADYSPPHTGHFKIFINDSLSILLLPPYKKESKRPTEEIKKFEGKKVKVTGSIQRNTFIEPPTRSLLEPQLNVSIPSFTDIKKIEEIR